MDAAAAGGNSKFHTLNFPLLGVELLPFRFPAWNSAKICDHAPSQMPAMPPAIRRFFALSAVFLLAFAAVFMMRGGFGASSWFQRLSQAWQGNSNRPEAFTLPDQAPLDLSDVGLLSRLNDEYARLTQAVVPSVVSIDTAGFRTERLLDIWGRTRTRRLPTQGQGSGVIVTREGHVVTNHHVIAGQQQIQVTLHGGRTFPADLIGEDPLLDIAVIKIRSEETFVPLKLGDSSGVQVGQLVFAVGNPFGLGETITQGIISAKERSLSDNQRDLFQTDAAINPGNSGGPLVNLRGEIIGINVAIFTPDRENPGFQGVGFSIPANDVRDTLYQILERGRPVRGYLGVEMLELDAHLRAHLRYPEGPGAVVRAVTPDSPAERAGLAAQDIIQRFNGETIRSSAQLISLVQRTRIGRPVVLGIWRAGQTIELEVTVAEPGDSSPNQPDPEDSRSDLSEVLRSVGLRVRDLSVQERLRGFRGIVVTAVDPAGRSRGVLQAGDLIVAINNQQVSAARDFQIQLATSAAVQETGIHLIRNGSALRVTLPAPGAGASGD